MSNQNTEGQPTNPESISDTSGDVGQQPPVEKESQPEDVIVQQAPVLDLPENNLRNVLQEFEYGTDYPAGKTLEQSEFIPFLAHTRVNTVAMLDNNPEADRVDTVEAKRWFDTTEESYSGLPQGGRFESTVERPDAQYRQYLDTEKGKLGFSQPKFAENEGAKLTGEQAVLRVRSLLGMGSIISIPLWHSGFWITIKMPSDSALIEMRRRVMDEKIRLGRYTHGLAYSNTASYTNQWVLDLIMDHMYATTVKDATPNKLRTMIKANDLPILYWGLACGIWPKGFQYVRSMIAGNGVNDKTIVEGRINVSKLMWVDNSAFTDRQKAHMSNRNSGVMTEDSIARYLDDFPLYKGRAIELLDGALTINLKVPDVDAYMQSGRDWITGLAALVEETFTADADDAQRRDRAILDHANATIMRQYSHYIDSIVVQGREQKDAETINAIANTMSEDTEARSKFLNGVGKFIDDTTYAVIAIPEVSGKETGLPRFPRLIPIDVTSVFFTLLMQRIALILNR